jgi:hypothetical protein
MDVVGRGGLAFNFTWQRTLPDGLALVLQAGIERLAHRPTLSFQNMLWHMLQ